MCSSDLHSIVWQYLGAERQAAVTSAMATAGANATPERPLAWIAVEANRQTFRHELTVRYWPGGGEPQLLAAAHAHGAWVEWMGYTRAPHPTVTPDLFRGPPGGTPAPPLSGTARKVVNCCRSRLSP